LEVAESCVGEVLESIKLENWMENSSLGEKKGGDGWWP